MGNELNETSIESDSDYNNFYESFPEIIGHGTFSIVKKCIRLSDKQLFAVKIINKNRLTKNELLLIKNEVYLLKNIINHPNIICIIDFFESKKYLRIVLELCQSNDLYDVITKYKNNINIKKMNETVAAKIICSIIFALKYLHNLGIVHRDLKPENILFANNGVIKLTDFGIAYYDQNQNNNINIKMNTKCGTPQYIAPEILINNNYGKEVDLWSLGCILYNLLSAGLHPFNVYRNGYGHGKGNSIQNLYIDIINYDKYQQDYI